MKTIKILFAFLFISTVGLYAQTTNNSEPTNYYKVEFIDINEFQLKEVIAPCEKLFDTHAQNKGDADILYFDSKKTITKEQLKKELENHEINFDFNLTVANDERE